jgi:hypothetical protein
MPNPFGQMSLRAVGGSSSPHGGNNGMGFPPGNGGYVLPEGCNRESFQTNDAARVSNLFVPSRDRHERNYVWNYEEFGHKKRKH